MLANAKASKHHKNADFHHNESGYRKVQNRLAWAGAARETEKLRRHWARARRSRHGNGGDAERRILQARGFELQEVIFSAERRQSPGVGVCH